MADNIASALTGIRNRHVFLVDLLVVSAAPTVAAVMLGGSASGILGRPLALAALTAVFGLIQLGVFFRFKLYHRLWRYASIDELARIGTAAVVTLVMQSAVFLGLLKPIGLVGPNIPFSMAIVGALISFPLVSLPRFSARLADRVQQRRRPGLRSHRVVVVGAGEAGVMIVQEMQANPKLGLHPIAFVDDDPRKHGLRIRGIEVEGPSQDLGRVAMDHSADRVVVAMPTASGKDIRRISDTAAKAGLSVRVIPGIYELLDGTVQISQLRPVQVEDLLRRPAVRTDSAKVGLTLEGKTVLVTGAGGSIGSELCRQIQKAHPARLVLLGQGENSVFGISQEINRINPSLPCDAVIANIRDGGRLRRVFERFKPDIVFHAAAHKHVPLMEHNPDEAVTNNVLGTRNLLGCCEAVDVERFVMISTDKAVNPANVMGSTKRIAEMLVLSTAARLGRPFMAVRFGNVLGSRGSVLGTFKEQIASGGPVTVTHPDMLRYFMTIPEAVTLVLQAGTIGKGGEVFVLDMGEPVKISDLARDLIRLSGFQEGEDIDIVYSGLRPGEKMFEELFLEGEEYVKTSHSGIFICSSPGASMKSGGDGAGGAAEAYRLEEQVDMLINAAGAGDQDKILNIIGHLVPTFRSAGVLADN